MIAHIQNTCQLPSVFNIYTIPVLIALNFANPSFSSYTYADSFGPWSQKTVDTIIDAEVSIEQKRARSEKDRLVKAANEAGKAAATVRKTTHLQSIRIVFLTDIADLKTASLPAALSDSLKKHEADTLRLRQELEGNALLYRALATHSVLLRDIIAARIKDEDATIFIAAKP